MGDVLVKPGGGGGVDCDTATAVPGDILAGRTAGIAGSDDLVTGTLSLTGNADEKKVLSGYTFYSTDAKSRLTGTLEVSSVVSFSVAQYSNLTLIASWAKPSRGPWSGLRVMCKQGSYPSNASNGTLFYEGSGTSATKSLAAGTWYFRAWNYITTNQGRIYGGSVQGSANNVTVKGQQVFKSSGIFTVPASVRSIDVFCVGGGGSGASTPNDMTSGNYCGGGGGGGYTKTGTYTVTPGTKYTVTVGAGGRGVAGGVGNSGGLTSMGSLISASGGKQGWTYRSDYKCSGGDGGSGGGGSSINTYTPGGTGGTNGSNGGNGFNSISSVSGHSGGKGQGTTTREFGSSSGALYSGGGGGGHYKEGDNVAPGGAGGGGEGACVAHGAGNSGSVNTGGGGGGSKCLWGGGNGGSGIAIIRWGY